MASLHTDAGSYGVDAIVVAFYGNLGTFAGNACNLLDGDQAVVDLGHFHFEQTLQEDGRRTAQNDFRIVVLVVHTGYHGTGRLTFTVEVARNLLGLGQQ